jgi:MFS family permease
MHRRTPGRALVAGGVGNVVEWYDFAVYGAFATVIATTYFPAADPIAGLSASFAVFATAFLARPVGAVLFGRLGDRVGRRQVLVTVIVLMAAATAGIGLLPGHAAIGVLAPVLLVVFRAAQGSRSAGRPPGPPPSSSSTRPRAGGAGTAPGCGRPWPSAWPAASASPSCWPGASRARCSRTGAGGWPSWSPCPSDWSGCTSAYAWSRPPGSRRWRAPTASSGGPSPSPCAPTRGACSSASPRSPRPR